MDMSYLQKQYLRKNHGSMIHPLDVRNSTRRSQFSFSNGSKQSKRFPREFEPLGKLTYRSHYIVSGSDIISSIPIKPPHYINLAHSWSEYYASLLVYADGTAPA